MSLQATQALGADQNAAGPASPACGAPHTGLEGAVGLVGGEWDLLLDPGYKQQPWAREMEEISTGLTPMNSCTFILKSWKTII